MQASCRGFGNFWETKEKAGSIYSFRFEAGLNGLVENYEGSISGNMIRVALPYGIVHAAIASFTTDGGAPFTVSGVSQISGETANDFRQPLVYSDGVAEYRVEVYPLDLFGDTGQTLCYTGTGAGDVATACSGNGGAYPAQDADFLTPRPRSFLTVEQHPVFTSDYTTRDRLTGLDYRSCSEGLTGATCTGAAVVLDWQTAAATCLALNNSNSGAGYAGRRDWRIPNLRELAALINHQSAAPTIDALSFPATVNGPYWTADEYAPSTGYGWGVSFNNGTVFNNSQKTLTRSIRCVAGNPPPAALREAKDDGTVLDRRSGLVWQKCSSGLALPDCSGAVVNLAWSDALNYCVALTLAGMSWRLPNINELLSSVDYKSAAAPPVDAQIFPATALNDYWSSTTHNSLPTNALAVNFSNTNTGAAAYAAKNTVLPVRCVANIGP